MKLAELRGFAFDLDGCIWAGAHLLPGAREFLVALRRKGKRFIFLSNNSRELAQSVRERLNRLGIEASPQEVLTVLELLGKEIAERFGRTQVFGDKARARTVSGIT